MSGIRNGFVAGAITGASCTLVMGSGVVSGVLVGGPIGAALVALAIAAGNGEESAD